MFWDRFYELCTKLNTKPNPLAKEIGISSGVLNKWKNGTIPNGETLCKIANYFNCSVDYLLGRTNEPAQTANVIDGSLAGSTDIQGSHNSNITVNSSELSLSDEEKELLRLFRSFDVRQRIKILNLAFSIESEAEAKIKHTSHTDNPEVNR